MSTDDTGRVPRLTAALREDSRVTPLELFFDLVFVLAITQCTALMARHPSWSGLAQGIAVLCVLWWSWVGYAWLTSVVDPEAGIVRLTVFAAMAAGLVCALCVPGAFGSEAFTFACAYAVVRAAHLALFAIGARGDDALLRSVGGLAASTTVGVAVLFAASGTDGTLQGALWAAAIVFDMGGPFLFGSEGWRLVPGHFAERHGLIVLIALGESIVAIGTGSTAQVDAGIVAASVLGIAVAATLWWMYFDVVALVAERRLDNAAEGRERNEIARDSYSYLHLPMVAGIVLVALGMKKTLRHVGDPLDAVAATALLGGAAVYLLAHVGFRLRNIRTLNRQRLVVALALLAALPLAVGPPALVTLAGLAAVLTGLVAYETIRFAEHRHRLRERLLRTETPA